MSFRMTEEEFAELQKKRPSREWKMDLRSYSDEDLKQRRQGVTREIRACRAEGQPMNLLIALHAVLQREEQRRRMRKHRARRANAAG